MIFRETPLHDISNLNPAITVSNGSEPSPSHNEFMAKTKPYDTIIAALKTKYDRIKMHALKC